MEQVHAELVRLAIELESVKGQVHIECDALRDLFARTTGTVAQHDRRLNHKEAERHLPQQFGGSRVDYGDVAFQVEGCAAVLSRDGQGGTLLMEVAELEMFESDTIGVLETDYGDVQQSSAAMAAALVTCPRGEVATLVRRILRVNPGNGPHAWHAVTQAASRARLISPKRTRNVNELQVAVMQWELTLVEHESKFTEVVPDSVKTATMRAMLPKDTLDRFLDGPFNCEELIRVAGYVGEKLAGQETNSGPQPTDIGQLDKSEGDDEDVNAASA